MTDSVIPPATQVVISRKEAIARGLSHYYTGVPCKHGHIALRTVAGACIVCSVANATAYHKKHPEKARAATAAWKASNIEVARERNTAQKAEYRKLNPEKVKASGLAWRERNREYLRDLAAKYRAEKPEILKAWRAANSGKVQEHKARHAAKHSVKCAAAAAAWRAQHPQRHRDNARAYRLANPEAVLATGRNRRAREKAAEGSHTAADIRRIYALQKGRCACCGVSVGKKYHVDHIIPLIKGGSNWPSNLQIACPMCNVKKRDKDPVTFMQSLGRLL